MPQTSLLNFVVRTAPPVKPFEALPLSTPKRIKLTHDKEEELVEQHPGVIFDSNGSKLADNSSLISSSPEQEPTPSLLASTSRLSIPNVYISPLDRKHLPAVKRLTTTLLPVRYQDKFYNQTLEKSYAPLCRVVLHDAEPIGWIRCRFDTPADAQDASQLAAHRPNKIYIQALCLLAPYRGRGVATALLDAVISSSRLHDLQATTMYAHVWEENEDALEWYERRGFKKILLADQYYRRLKPPGAWIVQKEIT